MSQNTPLITSVMKTPTFLLALLKMKSLLLVQATTLPVDDLAPLAPTIKSSNPSPLTSPALETEWPL
jgi:hypothetical protein